jgi:hypothetical protein
VKLEIFPSLLPENTKNGVLSFFLENQGFTPVPFHRNKTVQSSRFSSFFEKVCKRVDLKTSSAEIKKQNGVISYRYCTAMHL